MNIPFDQFAKELRAHLSTLGPGYEDEVIIQGLRSLVTECILERGVMVPCKKCDGLGTYRYSNTATWADRPDMISGQAFTFDTCDVCWGTGDRHRKGVDLLKTEERIGKLRHALETIIEVQQAFGVESSVLEDDCRQALDTDDALAEKANP